jgi:hypothetical protein
MRSQQHRSPHSSVFDVPILDQWPDQYESALTDAFDVLLDDPELEEVIHEFLVPDD